ncbi:hypothetical protein V8E53_015019 [Lactarius tabidus]
MAPKGIKTSKLFARKSKAKKPAPQQVCKFQGIRIDIVNQKAALHDANPQSMDVNEPFWIEEDIPEQRRSQHTYMEEFIPRIGPYLNCLLQSEGVPSSEVDREILYSIMVAGDQNKLVSWALWGFMPTSINTVPPRINLPEDWREYKNRNFQADHMKMKNPENDVPISESTEFMLASERWQHGGHLESTGIGATACIHGAFIPDSVVDFQKGEVQKNMDYSIFKALNFNMEGIEAAFISYDVMCQWSVHMMERVNGSNYLELPDKRNVNITSSGGLPPQSLHGSAVNTVSRHYQKALSGDTLSEAAFDSINVLAKPDFVLLWTAKEENAQREQGCDIKDMDIYNIKTKQYNEMGSSRSKRHTTWISSGIKIQEMQYDFWQLSC